MKRGEFKLGQTLILKKGIEAVRQMCEEEGYPNINCFVVGDFNAVPNSVSYNLFNKEIVNLNGSNIL